MPSNPYPSPDKYLIAEQKTLGELILSHDRQFIVPLNQRPWAWKDTRDVQHLLDDFETILTAFFDSESSPKWKRRPGVVRPHHFFGTFVFYKRSQTAYEIFDGQQRITAISMLCAVLREEASKLQNITGTHKAKAADLYGGLNDWLHLSPASRTPRLRPNTFFVPLFDALIFEQVEHADRLVALSKLPQHVLDHVITKRLRKSFDHIRAWVRQKLETLQPADATNLVVASYEVLRHLFTCVETLILNEQYSYEVFGCLNARGEQLTAADNIKNELFKVGNFAIHATISDKWQRIGEDVPNQDIGEFLRRRHIAFIAPCKKDDTYNQIKKNEIAKHDTTKLLDRWSQDSTFVRQITRREAPLAKKETLERLELIFDVLDVSLAYIPLLAAARKFLPSNKDDFHTCVCLVEKFVFRTMTIEQADTPEVERKLGEAARKLEGSGTLKDFQDYLIGQVDDNRFKAGFARHVERRVKVQYYVLRELETRLLGGGKGVIPGDHHSAKNHIEHILPKRLANAKGRETEWSWARANPDKHQSLVNRLGNLLILEHDINKEVANHEFQVKRDGKYKKKKSGKISKIKCYADSVLRWPALLCDDKKWTQWTESEIDKRQDEMAAEALKIWKP